MTVMSSFTDGKANQTRCTNPLDRYLVSHSLLSDVRVMIEFCCSASQYTGTGSAAFGVLTGSSTLDWRLVVTIPTSDYLDFVWFCMYVTGRRTLSGRLSSLHLYLPFLATSPASAAVSPCYQPCVYQLPVCCSV